MKINWSEFTPTLLSHKSDIFEATSAVVTAECISREEAAETFSSRRWVTMRSARRFKASLTRLYGYRESFITYRDIFFTSSDGCARIGRGREEGGCVYLEFDVTATARSAEELRDAFLRMKEHKPVKSSTDVDAGIEAMIYNRGKGEFFSLGTIGRNLERDNYVPEVLSKFDKVVREIISGTEHGRLLVIEGPPGTGKTFLVRAMLNACRNMRFLYVLPDMIPHLSAPSMLPVLVETIESRGRVALVIEDADAVLAPRMADNMAAVGTLLNMCSGILGAALPVYVVATTNAKVKDLDAAVARTGRMHAHIHVPLLPPDDATKRLLQLVPASTRRFVSYEPLSNVYAAAAAEGFVVGGNEVAKDAERPGSRRKRASLKGQSQGDDYDYDW